MEPFVTHRGVGIPLRRTNVDTDQIVPSRFLKRVSRTGFEDTLFAGWRTDPAFVLNHPAYRAGSVLVAGRDFGIGSSLEHAVWALQDHGIRVVISSRFGDIFRGNAGTAGLLTARVGENEVEALLAGLEEAPGREVEVDLEARTVRSGDVLASFELDGDTRWRLLNGLDHIDATLRLETSRARFEQSRRSWLPRTLPARSEGPAPVRAARLPHPG